MTRQINGILADPTGRGATYVVAASDAPAHVKAQADYVCDGTADEVEIQAVINSTTSGSILLIGTFILSNYITITNPIHLKGIDSYHSLIKVASSINLVATNNLILVHSSNVTISDLGFVIDYPLNLTAPNHNTGNLIESKGSTLISNVNIHNCRFIAKTLTGHSIPDDEYDSTVAKVINGQYSYNWRICDNYFEGSGFESISFSAQSVVPFSEHPEDIIVTNNTIKSGFGGIVFEYGAKRCIASNNTITTALGNYSSYGIYCIQYAESNTISGNTINTQSWGVLLGLYSSNNLASNNSITAYHPIGFNNCYEGNVFSDNDCYAAPVPGGFTSSAIYGYGAKGKISVSNNLFIGFNEILIEASGKSPIIMTENRFINCGNAQLYNEGSIIRSNKFQNCGDTYVLYFRHSNANPNILTVCNDNDFIDTAANDSTTLNGNVGAGETIITVNNSSVFTLGERLTTFPSGFPSQDNVITNIDYATNNITLKTAVTNDHTSGDAVTGRKISDYCIYIASTAKYNVVINNTIQRDITHTIYTTGSDNSTNYIYGNSNYILPGEHRTYSGSLSAGLVGNAVIAWQNPEAQAMMVQGTTRITAGATAASVGDWGLATTVQVIEDCEDVWNVTAPAAGHSTCAVDTAYVERGTNDIAITATAGITNADILAWEQTAATLDLSTITHITLKFRSNVALNAGDLSIALDQAADFGTPIAWFTLPAIAINTTTLVCINLNGGAAAGAGYNSIDSIGIRVNDITRFVSGKICYLDDIRGITVGTDLVNDANLQTLGQAAYGTTAPIHLDYKNNDSATLHDTLVMVSATNDSTGLAGSWYINGQGE